MRIGSSAKLRGAFPGGSPYSDNRILFDSIARLCFEKGLTGWGTPAESGACSSFSQYHTTPNLEWGSGDWKMSVYMAGSFIAWLTDTHGFETVSEFCFAKKTFTEAFGADFSSTFSAWRAWIIENYPME